MKELKTIEVILKNIAQVLLINSKWTGLLVLIGLFVANWKVGLSALLASSIAYFLAPYMNYSQEEIDNGLAGFSPVLTAIALILFIDNNWSGVLMTLIATILTLPMSSAIREFLKPYGVSMLTSPFVIMTWITVLIPGQVKHLTTELDIIPGHIKKASFDLGNEHIQFFKSLIEGFSQVFLVPNFIGGLFILVGIFIGSRKAGIYAVIANLVGFVIVGLLGGNYTDINEGLFGYNLVLTAIALGVTFKTTMNSYLVTGCGVLLTVFIHLGLNTLLEPFGLPALTMPFILATWLMLFAGGKHRT